MPFRIFRLVVEIPALDRLLGYLQTAEQSEIDAVTSEIQSLTARLKKSGDALAKEK